MIFLYSKPIYSNPIQSGQSRQTLTRYPLSMRRENLPQNRGDAKFTEIMPVNLFPFSVSALAQRRDLRKSVNHRSWLNPLNHQVNKPGRQTQEQQKAQDVGKGGNEYRRRYRRVNFEAAQ